MGMPEPGNGENTELLPQRAPVWMRGLVDAVAAGQTSAAVPEINRRKPQVPDTRTKGAAVLMLFSGAETTAELPADAEVLLTHRNPRLRSHSGQIAFPGGRIDAEDKNVVDTALREAWEETGLDRHHVSPLATLPELHIMTSGFPIWPVLGHWHTRGEVQVASPDELDEVLAVPVQELINPDNRLMVGKEFWRGPAFRINGYLVWGFTGGLLSAIIESAGWEEPWDKNSTHSLAEAVQQSRNNEPRRLW